MSPQIPQEPVCATNFGVKSHDYRIAGIRPKRTKGIGFKRRNVIRSKRVKTHDIRVKSYALKEQRLLALLS